ncbi:ornithine cyclodeaminase [Paracoccus sp. TK19116]|uniref:Ornithine cyclodeaminase n=1 Tax=Paracoccus albicereus TaxID=2922394 RepID=A0ABT1MPH1_9RHOB|nr:ornithine cyclodeaminase [Paracoccus albicereus]MCQ0970200.1 ornithine cyclodeaminase [Paracoccus albicereus]
MNATLPYLRAEDVEADLSWTAMVDAIAAGHRRPPARIGDLFLTRGDDTMLNRAAWIDGIGIGLKTVSVIGDNATRGLPTVQGVMVVFDDVTGTPKALLDSALITYWKTAADSGLGARHLARPDSRHLVILGAGPVAGSLARVYSALFPRLETIGIWNRTPANAEVLADKLNAEGLHTHAVSDAAEAVGQADIVACATMAREPVLRGDWVRPGTHVDLVGAFRPDMREADDALLRRARIFVDSRETTLDHIGELKIPLSAGVITRESILGDFHDLEAGRSGRSDDEEITMFKNGGGAHLDLMIAEAIIDIWRKKTGTDQP